MTRETALFETSATNAEIAADASETIFITEDDKKATQKFFSFNNLEIVNDSDEDILIDLDGLATRRRTLFGKSAIVIKAEQGIFFNNVKITNKSSATAIPAAAVNGIARIVRREEQT